MPGVVGGRVAGGRLVTDAPGRDDTTRGAGDTGAGGALGASVDVLAAGATGVGATDVGARGAGDVGAAGGVASTGLVGAGGATGAASGTTSLVVVAVFVVFVVRGLVTLAVPVVSSAVSVTAFLARFGFSAIGSRFRPFSSA